MTRVVVALGGNALIRRGEAGSIEVQHHNLLGAARALVDLEGMGHELVLTHGNGPQVGFLALEADAAAATVPPPPLDVLVAESMGQIGYLLAQAVTARLVAKGRDRPVTVVLTRTVVDAADGGFAAPSKPVGPVYDEPTARDLAKTRGWTVARDGAGWRRVVPSPEPLEIVEASSLRALVDSGAIVIASGGGGIPVARNADGALTGLEAVVDKDLAAVLLAEAVGAQALLLLTDVPAVRLGRGTAGESGIAVLTLAQAAAGVADGTFPGGSMGPKVTAAAAFVRRTGGFAAIGALDDAAAVLAGRAGTRLVADDAAAMSPALPVGAAAR
ncbi:MAG TPA: carbamate kinase [Candidatus Limnocylindrales bacterium]|jgi:carbamate kinase